MQQYTGHIIIHVLCLTDMDNENLRRISSSLHVLLTAIIGPEVFINVRRTTTNLRDTLLRVESELMNWKKIPIFSGSKAEGLRFKSSDNDWMFIYRDIKVILSDSYIEIYDSNTTLLLMENAMTKPGFTLLKLIGESTEPAVTRSTEDILKGRYLSCKIWRELLTKKPLFTHGPCASFTIGQYEYDYAYCLRCDIWPANAEDCIRRLHQSAWPSHETVLSIVNDGVLFVPIGSKQSIFENTEWRMSFSLAEKKLIHAMNHTQFLCYGLLKIFLKEAIDVNPDVKGLLCSYFLKTTLFWEIITTSNRWNPSTLLPRFWNCFRRLLQWVSCSYCPNFFIPQNNMFAGKIEGRNRDKLLQHLTILYYEGYSCLLRCQSLEDGMSLTIMHRKLILELEKVDEADIALEIIRELSKFNSSSKLTNPLTYQFASPTSSYEYFLLKTFLYQHLTNLSISGTNYNSADARCNKSYYSNLTQRMNVVRRCRTDSVTHLLYQAMLCYNNARYNRALRLVQQSKERISDPSCLLWHNQIKKKYKEVSFDYLPIETVLKKHYLDYIMIRNQYIPEFYFFNSQNFRLDTEPIFCVFIPPLVFAFFLQYLCQRKLGHLKEAGDALYELSLLIQHDEDEHHIVPLHQSISWHILGICQQINGDDSAACRSFITAQKQPEGKEFFKNTTNIRLGIILLKYF